MNAIIRNKSDQLHYFDEITVSTSLQPNGEYSAIDAENYDYDSPMGWGCTRFSAIADLFEKLPRAKSEREDRDALAAKWDHDRSLRNEGAV
jgi:hypothetical protein